MGVRWCTGAMLLAACLAVGARAQSVDPYNLNKNGKKATGEKTAGEWETVKTRFVPAGKLPYLSLGAQPQPISGSLNLPAKPAVAVVEASATKLQLDLNGDGRPDAAAKGVGTLQPLVLTYPDGKRERYAISITHRGDKWSYSAGGYRVGSYKGTPIVLVDMDSDGYYDGAGKDGMIVGRDRYVAYLSSMLSIKGKLYECKVSRSGGELKLKAWSGESGTIDLLKGYKGQARLGAAIVTNGTMSFNAATRGLVVPAGTYSVVWGHVRQGSKTAFFKGGGTFTVEAGKVAVHKLGYPYTVDFSVTRNGEKVTIDPNRVTIAGKGGESYYNFAPTAFTPKVQIRNPLSFKTLNSGTMTLC